MFSEHFYPPSTFSFNPMYHAELKRIVLAAFFFFSFIFKGTKYTANRSVTFSCGKPEPVQGNFHFLECVDACEKEIELFCS